MTRKDVTHKRKHGVKDGLKPGDSFEETFHIFVVSIPPVAQIHAEKWKVSTDLYTCTARVCIKGWCRVNKGCYLAGRSQLRETLQKALHSLPLNSLCSR